MTFVRLQQGSLDFTVSFMSPIAIAPAERLPA